MSYNSDPLILSRKQAATQTQVQIYNTQNRKSGQLIAAQEPKAIAATGAPHSLEPD